MYKIKQEILDNVTKVLVPYFDSIYAKMNNVHDGMVFYFYTKYVHCVEAYLRAVNTCAENAQAVVHNARLCLILARYNTQKPTTKKRK